MTITQIRLNSFLTWNAVYCIFCAVNNALVFWSRHSYMFPSSGLVIDLLKPNTFVHCYIPSVGFTAVISGRTVTGDCQGEMLDYRRMLMEDFSLSPEIVLHCRGEIEAHCSGLHRKGRTLHCLMRVTRGDKGTVDNLCQTAVRAHGIVGKGIGYLTVVWTFQKISLCFCTAFIWSTAILWNIITI